MKPSFHSRKYEMRPHLHGHKGTKVVLATWLLEAGVVQPRLITCHLE